MVQNLHVGNNLFKVRVLIDDLDCALHEILLGSRNVEPAIWYETEVKLFEIQRV